MSDQNMAVARQSAPTLSAEHKLLNVFAGRWSVDGQNMEGAPVAPNTKVTGEESYEWLPGKFFLVYHWDRKFGKDGHIGMGMIGYDPVKHTYSMHNYDNMGYERVYTGGVEGDRWTFTGEAERVTIVFSDGGRVMKANWDILNDHSDWVPLCELKNTKVQ